MYQLQLHKAHQCTAQVDRRFRQTPGTVTLTPPAHAAHSDHHHHHPDEDCSGCDGQEEQWQDEEVLFAIESKVQAFMEATGEELAPDTLAELSDLLLGVVNHGECRWH
jgi:hypothetical protein